MGLRSTGRSLPELGLLASSWRTGVIGPADTAAVVGRLDDGGPGSLGEPQRLPVELGAALLLHPEIPRIRMVEHERRDARLGVHHVSLGELDADLLRPQSVEQLPLEREVGTGRIAEAVALAAVAGGELVLRGEVGRVREPPVRA